MQQINFQFNNHNWLAYLRDEADQSVFNEIFKFKEYRAADEAIKNAKYPIVDVGAHAGFFSIYARGLNEKIKIFAVEPEPNNLTQLTRHIKENKIKNIKIVPVALAKETGERELSISADSHNHFIIPTEDLRSAQNNNQTLRVKAVSFSDFCRKNKIKKISLLKMDIEGGEYELFDGMSGDDFAMVNYVILEYHNIVNKPASQLNYQLIEDKLREQGFGVQVFPSRFDKTMGFVFANNKRSKF